MYCLNCGRFVFDSNRKDCCVLDRHTDGPGILCRPCWSKSGGVCAPCELAKLEDDANRRPTEDSGLPADGTWEPPKEWTEGGEGQTE